MSEMKTNNKDLIAFTRAYCYGQEDERIEFGRHRKAWDGWSAFISQDYNWRADPKELTEQASAIDFDFFGSDIVFLTGPLREETQRAIFPHVKWAGLLAKEDEEDELSPYQKQKSLYDRGNRPLIPDCQDEISFWLSHFGGVDPDDRDEERRMINYDVRKLAERLFKEGHLKPTDKIFSVFMEKPITLRVANLLYVTEYEFSCACGQGDILPEEVLDLYVGRAMFHYQSYVNGGNDEMSSEYKDFIFPKVLGIDPITPFPLPALLAKEFDLPDPNPEAPVGVVALFYLARMSLMNSKIDEDAHAFAKDILHQTVQKGLAYPILTSLIDVTARGYQNFSMFSGGLGKLCWDTLVQEFTPDEKRQFLLQALLQNDELEHKELFDTLSLAPELFSGVLNEEEDADFLMGCLIRSVFKPDQKQFGSFLDPLRRSPFFSTNKDGTENTALQSFCAFLDKERAELVSSYIEPFEKEINELTKTLAWNNTIPKMDKDRIELLFSTLKETGWRRAVRAERKL